MWVAVRDGRDVGSIAVIIDDHHNERYREATAFFGFFEAVNDRAVSRLLFDAVKNFARQVGMQRILGPMNPSINEECGLLVEGFDSPPVLMMTYNPSYYALLVEDAGLRGCKDLFAYHVNLDDSRLGGPPPRTARRSMAGCTSSSARAASRSPRPGARTPR